MELLEELKKKNLQLEEENITLRLELAKMKKLIASEHNKRNAGRHKQDFTGEIKKIKSYRDEGKTVKEIAKLLKCSERRIYRLLSL